MMKNKAFLLLGLVVLLSGCSQQASVKSGDNVTVQYTGMYTNGTIFNQGTISFIAGKGQVIKGFDNGIIGMSLGQQKTLTIPPWDAYGNYTSVPLDVNYSVVNQSVFNTVGQNANIGTLVYIKTTDGQQILTQITNISNGLASLVQVKQNPLQGDTLVFDVKILKIN